MLKKLDRETIISELEKENGPSLLANNPHIDKNSLLDDTAALFIEQGIGSALLVRLVKTRSLLIRLSSDPEILPAVRRYLDAESPKLRRNAARLLGQLSRSEDDAELLASRLITEPQRYVRPSIILSLGLIGGETAQKTLDAYAPIPPADETEIKHYDEECEALRLARVTAMRHEKHTFRGLDKPYDIELSAPDRLSEQLKEELEELGFSVLDVRRSSVNVKTDDYSALFEARCFSEALFTIAKGISLKPETVAPIAKSFILDFMRTTHAGDPPYRYRIEIDGDMVDIDGNFERTTYKRAVRDLIDDDRIVNAPSDYEIELRIVPAGNASRLYLKLFTVKDERFFYRKQTIAASMNPSTAAAVLRLASDYLTLNARVIDPCCGSGTLLFERGLIAPCASLTGVDIAHAAIDAARINADAAYSHGITHAKFICNDILRFESKRPYDELICNLPFGNRVGNHSSCARLYTGLLDRLPQLVKKGGVAVLYTMEFTLLKNLIRTHSNLEILKTERTEAGGLTPMVFVIRVN